MTKKNIERVKKLREKHVEDVRLYIQELKTDWPYFNTYDFICRELNLCIEDVVLPTRIREFAYARFIFASTIHSCTSLSLNAVGGKLGIGIYDHSYVIHAKEIISNWKDTEDANYLLYKRAIKYFRFNSNEVAGDHKYIEWDDESLPEYNRALRALSGIEIVNKSSCELVIYRDGTGGVINASTATLLFDFDDLADMLSQATDIINKHNLKVVFDDSNKNIDNK